MQEEKQEGEEDQLNSYPTNFVAMLLCETTHFSWDKVSQLLQTVLMTTMHMPLASLFVEAAWIHLRFQFFFRNTVYSIGD